MKHLILILLISCSTPCIEPLKEPVITGINDGTWHSNSYNLEFTVDNDTIMSNLSYQEAYGGEFTFSYNFANDSLKFDIIFRPEIDTYYTHTTMIFEWMYKSIVHLGIIDGNIYYTDDRVTSLYSDPEYITLEKIK